METEIRKGSPGDWGWEMGIENTLEHNFNNFQGRRWQSSPCNRSKPVLTAC